MKKIKFDNIAKFFDTTRQTISRWNKEEDKPALKFVYKYLDDESLEEFLRTNTIKKFEHNPLNEVTELQNYFLQSKAKSIFYYLKDHVPTDIKIIFGDFIKIANYQLPVKNIDEFTRNIISIKQDFYEQFTTFLYKNNKNYTIDERFKASKFMHDILDSDNVNLYFSLQFIHLLQANEMEKFDREVDRIGFFKAIVNKFF